MGEHKIYKHVLSHLALYMKHNPHIVSWDSHTRYNFLQFWLVCSPLDNLPRVLFRIPLVVVIYLAAQTHQTEIHVHPSWKLDLPDLKQKFILLFDSCLHFHRIHWTVHNSDDKRTGFSHHLLVSLALAAFSDLACLYLNCLFVTSSVSYQHWDVLHSRPLQCFRCYFPLPKHFECVYDYILVLLSPFIALFPMTLPGLLICTFKPVFPRKASSLGHL
jgi:hypothetical protein